MARDHTPDDDEGPHVYFEQFGSIPVVDRIDPAVQAQRKADADIAGAFHTPGELQAGMYHESPGVRALVVDRLVARGFDHPQTVPTFVDVLRNDPDGDTRFMVAMVLYRFGDDPRVVEALLYAMKNDPDHDVRAEAMSSLDELGLLND